MPFKWTRTWPDYADDGTGRDLNNPHPFGRVYRTHMNEPVKKWFWTVSAGDRRIASGHRSTKEEARDEADLAYADWLARNSGTAH